jgi:hypothetical protein
MATIAQLELFVMVTDKSEVLLSLRLIIGLVGRLIVGETWSTNNVSELPFRIKMELAII